MQGYGSLGVLNGFSERDIWFTPFARMIWQKAQVVANVSR